MQVSATSCPTAAGYHPALQWRGIIPLYMAFTGNSPSLHVVFTFASQRSWYNEIVVSPFFLADEGGAVERPRDLWADMALEAPDEGAPQSSHMLWRALSAVAIGALLGALAGTRYDLVFGLSQSLSAIVQAAAVAAAWTSIGI